MPCGSHELRESRFCGREVHERVDADHEIIRLSAGEVLQVRVDEFGRARAELLAPDFVGRPNHGRIDLEAHVPAKREGTPDERAQKVSRGTADVQNAYTAIHRVRPRRHLRDQLRNAQRATHIRQMTARARGHQGHVIVGVLDHGDLPFSSTPGAATMRGECGASTAQTDGALQHAHAGGAVRISFRSGEAFRNGGPHQREHERRECPEQHQYAASRF